MTDKATIQLGDTKLDVPAIVGTEDEHAIDVAQLRASGSRGARLGGPIERKMRRKVEGASPAGLALHPDASAHHLY